MRQPMTNPASLVLFGNPPKAKRRSHKNKQSQARTKIPARAKKETPVAHKKKKRTMSKRARAVALKNLAKARAARGIKSRPAKVRKARRARRAAKVRNIGASPATTVVIHKVKRGKVRKFRASKAKRGRYRVRVNPGSADSMGFLGGLRSSVSNVTATAKKGIKGYALLAAGAGGAVFAGSLMQRTTQPIVARFAPGLLNSAIGSRLFAAANFYATGWLAQRFLVPAKHGDVKRGILAGATVAAVLELIKPGLVRENLAQLPIVGGVFGKTLAGLESDLGSYVDEAMGFIGEGRDGTDSDILGIGPTVGAYEEVAGMGAYEEVAGLGCDSNNELVNSGMGAYETLSDDGNDY